MVGTVAPTANVLSGTVVTVTRPPTAEESLKPKTATPTPPLWFFHSLV